MADLPPFPDSHDDTSEGPDRGPTAGTPRWVKVFGIIAVVVILLFIILHLTRGPHRHGRHMPGGPGGLTPHSSVSARGVQQP